MQRLTVWICRMMRKGRVVSLLTGVALVASLVVPAAAYPRPGHIERVSLADDGSQADHRSGAPVVSADGRYVAFESFARNLVSGDGDGGWNVFLRDTATGSTEQISVASDGTEGDRDSSQFDMSGDARRIAFRSASTNLVPEDTNGDSDIFVRDRQEGTTVRVSIGENGAEADSFSTRPSISANGRYIAFRSLATNLVPDDTNGSSDLFVHDMEAGTTERVSVATDGTQSEGESFSAAGSDLSADGRFLAFESYATNLTPNDTNEEPDIFVHDLESGATERVSVAGDGSQASGGSLRPSITADGRFVTFESTAPNLVPGDTNGVRDIFIHDRQTGQTQRISVKGDGSEVNEGSRSPSISGNGRLVAFETDASDLVKGDDNGTRDVFVYDRESRSLSGESVEGNGPSLEGSVDHHGRHVAFSSRSSNLISDDDNGHPDVFLRDRGPDVGVGDISVVPEGGSVSVAGWATFSAAVSSTDDPADDGAPGAKDAGGELTAADLLHRIESEDLLLVLSLSSLPDPAGGAGAPGILYGVRFTMGETSYEIRAARSLEGPRFTLHRCASSCEKIADLTGAIGSTGSEVTVSAPLEALAGSVGSLTDMMAFTALGDDGSGGLTLLDSADLPDLDLVVPDVSLGIAPAGTLEEAVSFDGEASLVEGSFNGRVDTTSLSSGDYEVWARACHVERCGAASTPVTVDGGSVAGRTQVSFTDRSEEAGQYSDEATLEALLEDAGGDPISGAEVTFELGNDESSQVFAASTDASGVASVTVLLDHRPGSYRLTVRYAGTDEVEGSTAATNFEIDKEDTDVDLLVEEREESLGLTARLSDLDTPAHGIAERTINFYVNGEPAGSAQSDDQGTASIDAPAENSEQGTRYTGRFEGDDFYRASADTLYPPAGRTERVSVGSAGEANEDSNSPSRGNGLSTEGRYVAFHSLAGNLVPGDTNGDWDVFVRNQRSRRTERISVAPDGSQADDESFAPAITPDGRLVAFFSEASNLVPGDENGSFDIFVRDMESGAVDRVSVAGDGDEADDDSFGPGLSADGRYVVFGSDASNLVPGDTNEWQDIFVHDRETGSTERVSVASDGTEGNAGSFWGSMSADGRYVSFRSAATNLVQGDTNSSWDVFVHDRETGTTERISVTNDGGQANGGSDQSAISADGRFVAFRSHASNLVPQDTPASYDVFVRDRQKGTTERVSIATNGNAPHGNSIYLSISADGRYVTFSSYASNLVPDDTNSTGGLFTGGDVFVHDRRTRTTERVSVASDGSEAEGGSFLPSMSPDGRYVEFTSVATDLVPNDTNQGKGAGEDVFVRDRGPDSGVGGVSARPLEDAVSVTGWATFSGLVDSVDDPDDDAPSGTDAVGGELVGARLIQRPEPEDLLIRLDLRSMPSASGTAGTPGTLYGLSFSSEGTLYEARAARTTFGPRFSLHRCDASCTKVADLTGGIGSAGPEVLISLPHEAVGEPIRELTQVTAFTALGDGGPGSAATLDEIRLPDTQIETPTVVLGIEPAGTPRSEVAFTTEASLSEGAFAGELDTASLPFGEYEVWAKGCLGDRCGAASTPLTLLPKAAELTFTEASASSGQYSDEVTFEARLSQPDGTPLQGRKVRFTLSGESSTRSFEGVTDDAGGVSVHPTLEQRPGSHQLAARFDGDDRFGAAGDTTDFIVEREDTALELSVEGAGNKKALRARLSDLDTPSDAISQRTVQFYSDGELIGTDETDQEGVASVTLPPQHRGANRSYEAVFTGDDYYRPSTDAAGRIDGRVAQ